MPADLNKPFDPSCCEGSECNTNYESASPCGCDPGLRINGKVVGYKCQECLAMEWAQKNMVQSSDVD